MTSERLLELKSGAAASDAHCARLAVSVTDLARLTLDVEGRITAWKEEARHLLGRLEEEACALRLADLVTSAPANEMAWDLWIARFPGKLQRDEASYRRRFRVEFPL